MSRSTFSAHLQERAVGLLFVITLTLCLAASAVAGAAPLDGPQAVDPGPWMQLQPSAVGHADGTIFVAWTDFRGGKRRIRTTSMAPGEPWQASAELDPAGTGNQSSSTLAMDGKGTLYAVWADQRGAVSQIYFSYRPAGGVWQPGAVVSASEGLQYAPSLAVNTRGQAIVTWLQGDRPNAAVMAALRPPGGAWGPPEQVSPPGRVYNTSAAMDDWGRAYAAWEDWTTYQAYFRERAPDGLWGLLEMIRDDPTDLVWGPRIAVDKVGNVHAVWEDERFGDPGIFAAYRPAGGKWSANVQLSELGWSPGIGLDAAGNAIASWKTPEDDLYRAIRYLGGGWAPAELLAPSPLPANPRQAQRWAAAHLGPDAIASEPPSTSVIPIGSYTFYSGPEFTGPPNILGLDSPGPCSSMMQLAAASVQPGQFGGGNACHNGPQDPPNEGDPGFIGPVGPPEGTQIGGWHVQTQTVDGQTVFIVDTPGSDGIFTTFSDALGFASTYQYTPPADPNIFNLNLNDFPFGDLPPDEPAAPTPTTTPDPKPTPEVKQPQDNGPPAWATYYASAMSMLDRSWQLTKEIQALQRQLQNAAPDDRKNLQIRIASRQNELRSIDQQMGSSKYRPYLTASPAALRQVFEKMQSLPPGVQAPGITWLASMSQQGFAQLQQQVNTLYAQHLAEQKATQQSKPATGSPTQPQKTQPRPTPRPTGEQVYNTTDNALLNWLKDMAKPSTKTKSDPVLLHSGEFIYTQTPLTIPGRGFNYEFTLTYRSQVIYEGPTGWGWRHNYDQRLVPTGGGSFARQDSSGRLDEYSFDGVGFTPAVGLFTAVTVQLDDIIITDRDGTTETYLPLDAATAPGALHSIRDRNGNALTFAYDANGRLQTVTDTLGREITYAYDAQGFLTVVTDHLGRQVKLAYDTAGDLVSITSPAVTGTPHGNDFPNGKTTRFGYTSGLADDRLNHNLTTIISPNEVADGSLTPRTINTYGTAGLAFDRIVAQSWGGGRSNASGAPAGGDLTIAYATVIEPDDPLGAASKTTLTDRGGNVTEYWHDGAGHRLRWRQIIGGEAVVTDKTYNRDGMVASITYPLGNGMAYEYDDGSADRRARGNLLTIRQVADPARGCDGLGAAPCPALVTTMTYEPAFQQVKTITDPAGRTVTHSYDARGNRTRVDFPAVTVGPSAPQTATARWTYNAHGQPLTFTDAEGNVARYEYYASGPATGYRRRVTEASGDLNIVTTFEYDAAGNLTAQIDGRGVRHAYVYNQLDQMLLIRKDVAGLGHEVRYVYDANDNLVQIDIENVLPELDADFRPTGAVLRDPATPWLTTRFRYDLLDNLVQRQDEVAAAAQITTRYGYDALENLTSLTFPAGNRLTMTYNAYGQVATMTRGAGSPAPATTTFAHNANGKITRITNANGSPLDLFYDGFDRQVGEVDALGNIRRWQLDANGHVVSLRQFDGQEGRNPARLLVAPGAVLLGHAQTSYDERNRPYQTRGQYFSADLATGVLTPITSDGNGDGWAQTTIAYDRNSQVVQRVDDNGNARDYSFNGLSRLLTETDALGNVLTYTYDGNGNLVQLGASERQPDGLSPDETYTLIYEYDALNRMIGQTDAGGNTQSYRRDSRNNLVWQADANGNTALHAYDGLNRLLSSTRHLRADGLGDGAVTGAATTRNEYDANGNLTRFTDANGNASVFVYDALDRQISTTFADGSAASHAYDGNGNLTQQSDPNGSVMTHSYDALNRRVRTAVARGAGVGGTTLQTFVYDGLSRPTAVTDNNDPADAGDDSIARFTYDSLSNSLSETQNGQTVAATFDGVGNRLTLAYPGGATLWFGYDELNRVTVVDDGGVIAEYDYIGPRRVLRRSHANGAYAAYSYDAARRLTGIEYRQQADNALISEFAYTLDVAGNIRSEIAQPGNVTTTYAYDSLNRLVAFARPGLSQTFAYDLAGNRTQETRNGRVTAYRVDALNRYTHIDGVAQTHDANGNLRADGRHHYEYDALNRLIAGEHALHPLFLPFVAGPNSGAASGQTMPARFSELIPIRATHTYDALDRRISRQGTAGDTAFLYDGDWLIEERNGAEALLAAYIGDLLMERAGQRRFYHTDALGSVRALAGAGGAVIERVEYEAFGQPLFAGGATASVHGNPNLFRGLRYDAADGLYVLGGQRYDPGRGRHLR